MLLPLLLNSFILTNRLLKAGQPVFWLREPTRANGRTLDPGALWIPASDASRTLVAQAREQVGAQLLQTAPNIVTRDANASHVHIASKTLQKWLR